MQTVKVKPWGKDQGDYVLINAEDFDPAIHTLLEGELPRSGEGEGAAGSISPSDRPLKSPPPRKPAERRKAKKG